MVTLVAEAFASVAFERRMFKIMKRNAAVDEHVILFVDIDLLN